ncbi:MAG: hypothetical protein IJ486_07440 [Firmicutes bacterium]|nr:hypothetical protein [Bacillota bacterium]
MKNVTAEPKEIPVYLFTGFLDGGKSTFVQSILEEDEFNAGEKTLVLLCEEGEIELEPEKFAKPNVTIVSIEEQYELTEKHLSKLMAEGDFERVVIEYNGMWGLDLLYEAMPDGWLIYQEMMMVDGSTFMAYNTNMRNLVYDKLKSVETVVFNRLDRDTDKMPFHQIIRAANRRCEIIYEYGPDDMEIDEIEDPLPFDIDAPIVDIKEKDYAHWYRDIIEEEDKYYGKTIRVMGRSLLDGGLDKDEFVIGRHIMTCCVDDIQFGGLVAKYEDSQSLEHGGWVIMTAKIHCEYNKMYGEPGPVFHVIEVEKCDKPENEVATFY